MHLSEHYKKLLCPGDDWNFGELNWIKNTRRGVLKSAQELKEIEI